MLAQTYAGRIEVLVVHDQSDPDFSLELSAQDRAVRVLANGRRPGLAGARNSGIEEAAGEYIAFCDDDDVWSPGKLAAQVSRLEEDPSADFATCGITVLHDGRRHDRVLRRHTVTFADLLRDRHTELHPSTFLFRREAAHNGFGLVDEAVPGGFGEDYEFLLRAARRAPIAHVPEPWVTVRWGAQSFFFQRWQTMSAGLADVLAKYPEFESVRAGSARIRGQIAFAHAAQASRREACRWAASAIRRNPLEPRAFLALGVATGWVSPAAVMTALHRHGKGI
ncbi:glycosyltransferase family 2 protein [Paenarthrobacter sp. DKR-5]|nr:glycosyltransferase family 2 protein [Paenarthrobacter sp. DKR-5]